MAFTNGQTVYLSDGQEVEYIAGSPGEHVIRPIMDAEDDDEEPRYGRPFTVYEVFVEAPVAKYDERIAALKVEVDQLSGAVKALRDEKSAFERDERDRRERLRMHGQLETIDNLLSGKITHVVLRSSGGIAVKTIKDAVKGDREYSDLCGLHLKASSERGSETVRWTVGDTSRWVFPCTSQEQAGDLAAKLIEAEFEGHRKNGGYNEDMLRLYASLGRNPPADLAEKAHKAKVSNLKYYADKAEAELASYRERLAALEAPTLSAHSLEGEA